MIFWIIKNIPGALRMYNLIAMIIVGLSTEAPQEIKEKYEKSKIDVHKKINEKHPKALVDDEDSKYSQKVRNSYKYYAEKFEFEAKQKWGRASPKYAYESAWAYSLAAYFYNEAECFKDASDNYHYAANTFRNLGAINQAIKHYEYSADSAEERDEWKERNLNRVRALKVQIGEEDTLKQRGRRD